MSFEVSGKLLEKYPMLEFRENFKKREFVISQTESSGGFEFTNYLKFQLIQDKCNLIDPFEIGDELKIYFNLKGRKWEKDGNITYFTNLEAWKIDKIQEDNKDFKEGNFQDNIKKFPPEEEDFNSSPDNFDDLPF